MRSALIMSFTISLAACGGSSADPDAPVGDPADGSPGDPDAAGDDTPDANPGDPDAADTGAAPTIFTIVLENQDYADIIGSPNAPYLNSLIADYGLATNYHETGDPSLPNYLHMISGANQYFGLIDVDPQQWPFFPVDTDNLGTQLEAANIRWRSYQEAMGQPCRLTASGTYAPKHDPVLYFTDIQTGGGGNLCAQRNVDYGQHFQNDLDGGTYRYMWITPDMEHDGHDPSLDPAQGLRQADEWASQEIPKILASEVFQAGGVLFVTWDEAEARNGHSATQIPMIVISPRIVSAGFTSNTELTHASYLATIEDLLGLPRLATVTSAPSMMNFLTP